MMSVDNKCGRKSATISVRVMDTPGEPGTLSLKDVTLDSVLLEWSEPNNDGDSEITNYVIEKREEDRRSWSLVSSTCKVPSWTVSKLETGKLYMFRVMAQNKHGVGVPTVSPDAIKITKEPGQVFRFEVTSITRRSAVVAWEKPIHNGGSRITGYLVQLCSEDSDEFDDLGEIKTMSYKVWLQRSFFCKCVWILCYP